MEPITHFLTGACIGRAGLNRKTAYATLVAVLAAEAADIDVLWAIGGPVEELKHHRGITHTFIAAPVVAAATVGVVWLYDRWVTARRLRKVDALSQNAKAPPPAPLDDPLGLALSDGLALRVQPPAARLDEQLRPASILSVQPALVCGQLRLYRRAGAAGSARLGARDSGAAGAGRRRDRRAPAGFRGRGWAIFALTGMVLLWGWRWAEQGRARMLVENAQVATAPVTRMAFEPYPINPFRWHAILETAGITRPRRSTPRTGEIASDPRRT